MTDKARIIGNYVESIVKGILQYPETLKVQSETDDQGVFVQITVNKADMGAIVGKEGQTAKAIRTLVRIKGSIFDTKATVKILEPTN